MKSFEYAGPGPVDDGDGGVIRPGDVRAEGDLPLFGPWRELPAAGDDQDGDGRDGAERLPEPLDKRLPEPSPASPPAAATVPPAPGTEGA